jgi:hypothetical protein
MDNRMVRYISFFFVETTILILNITYYQKSINYSLNNMTLNSRLVLYYRSIMLSFFDDIIRSIIPDLCPLMQRYAGGLFLKTPFPRFEYNNKIFK